AEHLGELHERAAQLLRAGNHPLGVPNVRFEQRPLRPRGGLEGPLHRLPEVAAADRGREPPDRQHPPGAPRRDLGHHPRCWFTRVAPPAAPPPLSMFTTTTPAAQLVSMPGGAASPWSLVP